VVKTIVVEGDGWETPKDEDEVLVTYTLKVGGGCVSEVVWRKQDMRGTRACGHGVGVVLTGAVDFKLCAAIPHLIKEPPGELPAAFDHVTHTPVSW
jgi:hypothetical protein